MLQGSKDYNVEIGRGSEEKVGDNLLSEKGQKVHSQFTKVLIIRTSEVSSAIRTCLTDSKARDMILMPSFLFTNLEQLSIIFSKY